MRLTAQARITLPGTEVFRKPSFWDNVKSFLGSDLDLRTGESQVTRDVLGLTEQIQQGLHIAGIHNAVSLAVDTDIVYQDLAGTANDADLLVEAMRRAHTRFTDGFKVLRAVFELEADGLHSLIEVTVRAVHKKEEPSATIAVGARITELRPRDNESMEAAKERIGKSLANAQLVPMYRNILNAQMQRLQAGLQRVFANGRVEVDPADVQVVRPSGAEVRELGSDADRRQAELRHDPQYPRAGHYGQGYDPWNTYYRDPMDTFVNLMVLNAIMSPSLHWGYGPGFLGSHWSSYGAPVQIINYNGTPFGNADQIGSFQHQLGDVHGAADLDFGSAQWNDSQLAGYAAGDSSWDQHREGPVANPGGTAFDCVGYGGDTAAGGGSFDCAASDCAASDCSYDCSHDCSSDCSWDCGGGGDW